MNFLNLFSAEIEFGFKTCFKHLQKPTYGQLVVCPSKRVQKIFSRIFLFICILQITAYVLFSHYNLDSPSLAVETYSPSFYIKKEKLLPPIH